MTYKLGEYLKELRGSESLRSVAERTNNSLSHSYISDVEKGVSRRGNLIKPSPETLKVLAKVYNTDYNHLMELAGYIKEDKIKPSLSEKETKDIAIEVQNMLDGMNTDAEINFYGEPMSDDDKELLAAALETALQVSKRAAKKKFTRNDYKEKKSGD